MSMESEQILKEEPTPGVYVKRRYVFAVLQFFGSVNVLTVRNSFSIAIVAMVNQSEPVDDINDVSNQTGVCPDRNVGLSGNASSNGVFNWNSAEQGLVLGCYFYGYMLSNVLGAWLSKKLGMKWVVAVAMLVSSILTACIPPAAYFSFGFLIAIRVLTGLFQGVVTPSLMGAWGVWAPPAERGALVTIFLSGGSFGIFLALMVGGIMSDEFGWESVFYLTAGGMLLWTVAWAFLAFESPDVHPRISEQEKRYIINSTQTLTEEKDKGEKQNVPWKAMLTSPAIYAFFVGMFTTNWGNFTLQTMLPTYLSTVLRFDLTKNSINQWQIVFWITAAINLFGIAFYLVFAAGNEQDWAKPKTENENDTNNNDFVNAAFEDDTTQF